MHRPRGGAAFGIAPPAVLLALGAGWAAIAAVLVAAAAAGLTQRLAVAVAVSAAAAWLVAVVLAVAAEELAEAVAGRDDREPAPHQGGWRRPVAPLVALAFGLALGYLLWR